MGPAMRRAARTATPTSEEVPAPVVSGFDVNSVLTKKCQEANITFDQLKSAAGKYEPELSTKPADWKSFTDIPPLDAYTIFSKIKQKEAETTKAAR